MKFVLNLDHRNVVRTLMLAAVSSFLFGCTSQQPQEPQTDAALEQKVSNLERSLAEIRKELQTNQAQLLTNLRQVKGAQQTMIRRGILIDPGSMERPMKVGEQTGVRIGEAPTLGPDTATVEIVEFGEFQCPFCMKSSSFLRELVEEYPGQVRVAFKHYPISRHKMSADAAKAAWAAQQQGKFWEMHDLLFSSRGKLDDDVIRGHAEAIGLDMDKFDEDSGSYLATKLVFDDRREAKLAKLKGTPSFYVNGRFAGGNLGDVRKVVQKAVESQAAALKKHEARGAAEKAKTGS